MLRLPPFRGTSRAVPPPEIPMASVLYRLGHLAVRRRRAVLASWLLLLVVVSALAMSLGGETSDRLELPGTESQQAFDLLDQRFPEQGGSSTRVVIAAPEGATLTDPSVMDGVDATFARIAEVDGVTAASPPAESGAVAPGGTVAFGEVRYAAASGDVEAATLDGVESAVQVAREAGLTVEFGGDVIPGQAEHGSSSEVIGLIVAVVVLLVSFGSVLAMGLPLLTALIGLGVGLMGISLMSAFVDLSSTAPTLATMIGLAVGIDYALFIVTRHRQNLADGLDIEEAAARANATAGGAVVFAGVTVMIALSGLAVIGMPFLTVMGLAAAATVAVAVLVAVTLLPAMLGFVGPNIDRFRVPGLKNRTGSASEGATLGSRWAARVTRRPVVALVTGLAIMGVLAIPFASMRLGLLDDGSAPPSTTNRQAYDLLAAGFGPGSNGPLTIVVDLEGVADPTATLDEASAALRAEPGVVDVTPAATNPAGDTAVLTVVPSSGPSDEATESLVHRLRGTVVPDLEARLGADVYVTGTTAANIDISDKLGAALPVFMVLVIGLTVLLLTIVFRSILVPIKAAVAILISIASAFGVVVAIFQWGWLKGVVGIEEALPIVSFLPMMMFAILFGLSMDYEVFILSRIREEYSRTGDARGSVLTGLTSSARVITAAALIMISVFAAFVLGDEPVIKMFGIGLSVAVLLDATVVRMVLVPAVMTLLDRAAWWLPRWLDRALPNLDVEGEQLMLALEAEELAQGGGVDDDDGDGDGEKVEATV
jgi:RND superfamily putative drug exporter